MNDVLSSEVNRIEEAFDRIGKDRPSLKPIADSFRELLVSRARLKAAMPDWDGSALPAPDPARHAAGTPVLAREDLARLADPWGDTVEIAIAPLATAFPSIEADVHRLKQSLEAGNLDLGQAMRALLGEDGGEMDRIASRLGFRPEVLAFLLGQVLKPFVEKRTGPLQAPVRQMPWHRGYCPVCGHFPEITFIQGEAGQRWLRCSLCGYEWQFNRMLCPHCEAQGQKKNLIHVEGRQHEFAELWPGCRRYIVGIDLRESKGETITAATAIGLVHLDIMAQERGYSPIAVCAWNVLAPSAEEPG